MDDNEFLLVDRIQKIRQIIGKYGEENFYMSFSGGRDSTVLHYLLDEAIPGNRIPRVYFNTGIEFRAVVRFVEGFSEQDDRFEIIPPNTNIKSMLEKEGFPFKSKSHSKRVREYQNNMRHSKTTYDYANCLNHYSGKYGCPKNLKQQFSPNYGLKISEKCCERLKKDRGKEYEISRGKSWAITGIMKSEGGARQSARCIVLKKGHNKFHPMFPVTKEWANWYVTARDIRLCGLYYPPYNFERTGCKGCPFNIKLQQELDTMAKLLPAERKQCERIWKPVYDEYRRLDYRLKSQISFDDLEVM